MWLCLYVVVYFMFTYMIQDPEAQAEKKARRAAKKEQRAERRKQQQGAGDRQDNRPSWGDGRPGSYQMHQKENKAYEQYYKVILAKGLIALTNLLL